MNSTLDTLHHKICAKFGVLLELFGYLKESLSEYEDYLESVPADKVAPRKKLTLNDLLCINPDIDGVKSIRTELECLGDDLIVLNTRYIDIVTPILSRHHQASLASDVGKIKTCFDDYCNDVVAGNIPGELDNKATMLDKVSGEHSGIFREEKWKKL